MNAVALVALFLAGLRDAGIQKDERVVFFPTTARRAPDGKAWEVPVHGWIFEPEERSIWREVACRCIRDSLTIDGAAPESETFKKRLRAFLVDDERDEKIRVRLGDRVCELPPSSENGHFEGLIRIEGKDASKLLLDGPGGGYIRFRAVTLEGDGRTFDGEVRLVEESGLSAISDIDDTIKVSEVRDKKALIRNTFLRDFEAVPGMAALYSSWARRGVDFHYVSASPWQLYEPLTEFQERSGFPKGSFHMKRFRWKDSDFFQLFGDAKQYKEVTIAGVLKRFPRRRFILVGDSGEKDPEAYGELARTHGAQIVLVLIRDVTGEGADSQRMQEAFRGLPAEKWRVFRDPAEAPALEEKWLEESP